MREVRSAALPTLEVLPELAAGCLVPVGAEGLLVPIELPIRPGDRRSELASAERETLVEPERLLELAAGCFASVEMDGLSILIELLALDLESVVGRSILIDRLRDEDTDGVLVPIEVPIRELPLALIDGRLEIVVVVDGVLVLIELPMRDLELVLNRFCGEDTDGVLVVIELPIRALLLGLICLLVLLLIEVVPLELLLIDVLEEGLPGLEGLLIVMRLEVDPLELLLEDIVVERPGADCLTGILVVLLRLGIDRLEEIELERLGVDRLVDDLTELLLLELDRLGLRLDIVVLDRLGVGALLTDVLLELLRLDVMDLVGGLTDRELLALDELADTLVLRAGVDLAACVF